MAIRCIRCCSTNLQSSKKGFSTGKAVVGAALAGPVGLAAGAIGSNKQTFVCMDCGKTFTLSEYNSWNARIEADAARKRSIQKKVEQYEEEHGKMSEDERKEYITELQNEDFKDDMKGCLLGIIVLLAFALFICFISL